MRATQASLGIIAVVLLFFGFAAYGLTGGIDLYVGLHLAVGFFALVAYLASGRESLRAFLGERSTRYGANAILYSALFAGIVVMLNFLGTRYSFRIDTTEAQVFSLSPQSAQVVADLEQELELTAFPEGGQSPMLEDLFDSYVHASDRVRTEIFDPEQRPELAERYNVTQYNTVRVAYGDNTTLVTEPSEQSITNAIIKVTQAGKKEICFVEGHGEPDPDEIERPDGYGQLRQSLLNENYEVRKILLAALEKIPDECDAVVVSAPRKPYVDGESEVLRTYLESRGRALFLFAPNRADFLASFVEPFGIGIGDDVVVDQVIRLFQGPALGLEPIASSYGTHPITQNFDQRTVFPLTRSVDPVENRPVGVNLMSLVQTSAESWAETDLEGVFERSQVTFDPPEDERGPVSIAVAAQGELEELGFESGDELRLVAFGSTEFTNNRSIQSFYNRDLALNAIGWIVGEEQILSIRPRQIRASTVQLTQAESRAIFYLVLLFPEILLVVGIVVWANRRGA